jgi:arylsulfatase A-like enzyme/Tfp pilus assembly protein PilF
MFLIVSLAIISLPSFAAAPPNIILITLDTTRADRMGFLGSKLGLTPNLDLLAKQGIVFPRAYAHVPLTVPSHATILTGTYPQFSQVRDMGDRLGADIPYLPDILHHHGYRTAAFVGSQVLDPKGVAVPGFDRGFDSYDAGFHSRGRGEDRYHSVERRATEVLDRAATWLDHHPKEPFFLWIHLYDPHDPYDPPMPFKAKYAGALYDGEIAYTDFAVGKLLTTLHSQHLYDGALIVVVADHGEALGEHGERSHGLFLYDETIHVPLMIKLPAERGAGMQIGDRVGLVDIAPTLLSEVEIQVPSKIQGMSLLNLVKAKSAREAANSIGPERPAYAETDYPYRAFGWSPLQAFRKGKYTFIKAPERELYDQSTDSGSLHNLASSSKAVADTMALQLDEFHRKTSNEIITQAGIDAEHAEQLEALGYVASGVPHPGMPGKETGPDPKEKIETANQLHEALLAMEEDRYEEAIPRLENVLKQEPDLPLANLELGRAWNRLKNYHRALPWLQRAIKLTPESGRAHFELGMALVETNDWAGAAPQLETALIHTPESDELEFDLATVYEQLGRTSDAERAFQSALRLNPNNYRANLLYGRLLGMRGDPMSALPYLQKAIEINPQLPDGHKFLSNVYLELGRENDASAERKEAERLQLHENP